MLLGGPMMLKRRFIAFFSVFLLALMALPLMSQASEPPFISTTNTGITAGQRVEFTGANFWRNEKVVFWGTAPDQSVISGNGYTHAEGNGGYVIFGFDLPRDAMSGTWAVTAYGIDSQVPAIVYFDVYGRDPASVQPAAAVVPNVGWAGTDFSFAATGYKTRERISYWVSAPGGAVFAAFPDAAQSRDGRVDLNWRAPAGATPGTWVMTIQGLSSGTARAIPFEIQ
jgi:hypothetical protein